MYIRRKDLEHTIEGKGCMHGEKSATGRNGCTDVEDKGVDGGGFMMNDKLNFK